MRKAKKIYSDFTEDHSGDRNSLRYATISCCLPSIAVVFSFYLLLRMMNKPQPPSGNSDNAATLQLIEFSLILTCMFICGAIAAAGCTAMRVVDGSFTRLCPQFINTGLFKLCHKEPVDPAIEGYSKIPNHYDI